MKPPLLCDRDGACEFILRDVEGGLGQKQGATGLDHGRQLTERAALIGQFVHHGEGQGKIDAGCATFQAETIFGAHVRLDPIGQTGLRRSAGQGREHLRLDVDTDDLALRTRLPRPWAG